MLAFKALRGRGLRAPVAVLGVAVICVLVLVLRGAGGGVDDAIEGYAGQPAVDLWVMPVGTESLLRATALLPEDISARVASVDGVASVAPLARAFSRVEHGDTHLAMLGLGYDVASGMGGPKAWAAGRAPSRAGEVALDRVGAWRLDVGVGDEVLVNGTSAEVVGLSVGTNLLVNQFVFQTPDAIGAQNGTAGRASYLLVALKPGVSARRVADAIEAYVPATRAWTREDFTANNQHEAAEGFRPILALSFGLGAATSAILVALIVHGLVEDRRADMAVLLALGASSWRIALALLLHGVVLVTSGCVLGVAAAYALAWGLDRWVPVIPLSFSGQDTVGMFAVFLISSVLATAVSVLRLRQIDPMEAFRS